MMEARDPRRLALVRFASFAGAMLVIEAMIARMAAAHPGSPLALAVLVDLVVVLPVAFWMIVLRPAGRPYSAAIRVVAVGALVAGFLLRGRAEVRLPLEIIGAIVELSVLALLARTLGKASRELRGAPGDDLLLRMATLTDPMLRVAGSELAVLRYAFVGPRPPVCVGDSTSTEFGYVETSGLGGLLIGAAVLVLTEGFAAHVVLQTWSPRVAWLLTATSAYALVWFVALFRAARQRPIVLSNERLLVRTSLLWTVIIPRASIASVRAIDDFPRSAGTLRATLGPPPVLLVTLTDPVEALGPVGIRRSVTRVALHLDEPGKLQAALTSGDVSATRL